MQLKPALLLAACGAVVGALAMTPLPAAAVPAADPDCPAVPELQVNSWIGPQLSGDRGLWDIDENWSLGHYPRSGSTDEVACIRTAGSVVMRKGAGLRVHVAAIDVDGGGVLEVLPSNQLFVEANPDLAVSRVAASSGLTVEKAVLGGHGRTQVLGVLTLTAPRHGKNVVTTRQCARDCRTQLRGRHGTISVEAGGRLRVVGGPARVTDGYHVVVAGGKVRMQGERGLVIADPGTRLGLRKDPTTAHAPALILLNNGGWYASRRSSPHVRVTRVVIHDSIVVKAEGKGTSSIQGNVRAKGQLNADVRSGTLAIENIQPKDVTSAVAAGARYSTGSCPDGRTYNCEPVASNLDKQTASVKLPGTAEDVTLTISEIAGPTTLGEATEITPVGNRPDVGHERSVTLELRYDSSILTGQTPTTTVVEVDEENGSGYGVLSDCGSTGRIPNGQTGCVDRARSERRSAKAADSDLVMVVRTLHFSRYICH